MFEAGETELSQQDDPARKSPSLSEISHLFLSTVREKTEGGARPHRRPPGQHVQRPAASIDLTPSEFARAFAHEDALRLDPHLDAADSDPGSDDEPARPSDAEHALARPNVAAVLAGHFGARQQERVRDYARLLAAGNKRVGLIEVDASLLRLFCFDGHAHSQIEHASVEDHAASSDFDARLMSEALEEMAWDVEQWLVSLPATRLPEARTLLRSIEQWVLLSTSDHDGVVASYRTMKGAICDLRAVGNNSRSHQASLAVLDGDPQSSERVHKKLANVCDEFLNCRIECQTLPETTSAKVAEHLVMTCAVPSDKSQPASGAAWEVIANFVRRGECAVVPREPHKDETSASSPAGTVHPANTEPDRTALRAEEESLSMSHLSPFNSELVENVVSAEESRHFKEPLPETATPIESSASIPMPQQASNQQDDVIDLVGGDSTETGIIASVLRRGFGAGNLIECPIAPPMRASARLAVTRQRRLTLIAVARQGLSDLRSIGETYRWLVENRPLISMALPQMSIDAHAMPHLNLLIDQGDTSAELLQPLLSASHVTVRAYRTLRWGGRTGLLLEAA